MDDARGAALIAWELPPRLLRQAAAAGATFADYAWTMHNLQRDTPAAAAAYEAALEGCHERGAVRLLKLCLANGGIYVKLGQHVAVLDHLFPAAYVRTLRARLLNRCAASPWEDVRRVLREDLLAEPESLFAEIRREPIAVASLAQVHEAWTPDGRHLAVKVQHRGLRDLARVDLFAMDLVVRAVRWAAPAHDYQWLIDETSLNLPLELDFEHEAQNVDRCRESLASGLSRVKGRVSVPHVHRGLSSGRVLTMEFVEGVPATDARALERAGVSPSAVAALISETFNDMIFVHGFVHCDPHPANLLVRLRGGDAAGAAGKRSGEAPRKQDWELVVLDHGLYRALSPGLRLTYARLWHSLILGDVPGIERACAALGAGEMTPILAAVLTQRPWQAISQAEGGAGRLSLSRTAEEREALAGLAGTYAAEIAAVLSRIPRPLLLLLKTNDCLRAVDAELGQTVGSLLSTARTCALVLQREDPEAARGRWQRALDWARLEGRLGGLRLLAWVYGEAPGPVPQPLLPEQRVGGEEEGGRRTHS